MVPKRSSSSRAPRKRKSTEQGAQPSKKSRKKQETEQPPPAIPVAQPSTSAVETSNRDIESDQLDQIDQFLKTARFGYGRALKNVKIHSGLTNEDIAIYWSDDVIEIKQDVKSMVEKANEMLKAVKSIAHDVQYASTRYKGDEHGANKISEMINSERLLARIDELTSVLVDMKELLNELPHKGEDTPGDTDPPKSAAEHQSTTQAKSKKYRDDGVYVLKLVPITEPKRNPLETFYEVMEKTPFQVVKSEIKAGAAHITVRSRQELDELEEKVAGKSPKGTKSKMHELFTISKSIASKFMVVTAAFPSNLLTKFDFVKDGRINEKEAKALILMRNDKWFKSPIDLVKIDLIKTSNEKESKHLIKMSCSGPAFGRMMRGKKKGHLLDLVKTRLPVFDATESPACFNCHRIGHKIVDCPEDEIRCKYCPGSHSSGTCDSRHDKNLYRCYRCRQFNLANSGKKSAIDEKHEAGAPKCPFTKADRAALSKKRNKA